MWGSTWPCQRAASQCGGRQGGGGRDILIHWGRWKELGMAADVVGRCSSPKSEDPLPTHRLHPGASFGALSTSKGLLVRMKERAQRAEHLWGGRGRSCWAPCGRESGGPAGNLGLVSAALCSDWLLPLGRRCVPLSDRTFLEGRSSVSSAHCQIREEVLPPSREGRGLVPESHTCPLRSSH